MKISEAQLAQLLDIRKLLDANPSLQSPFLKEKEKEFTASVLNIILTRQEEPESLARLIYPLKEDQTKFLLVLTRCVLNYRDFYQRQDAPFSHSF